MVTAVAVLVTTLTQKSGTLFNSRLSAFEENLMPLSEDEVYRVRHQLAVEEYERRKAAEQNKPSFLGWLGRVGLGFIVTKILEWLWTSIRKAFGLI